MKRDKELCEVDRNALHAIWFCQRNLSQISCVPLLEMVNRWFEIVGENVVDAGVRLGLIDKSVEYDVSVRASNLSKNLVKVIINVDIESIAEFLPVSPIDKLDLDLFDKVITTNLRGTFVVLGQASRQLSPGGRIIAFSSSVIGLALPTYGPYIASKAGVEGLVHVLANELRGRNITVNAVAPGPVATELFLTGKDDAQIEHLRKLLPLERLGQPEDIANLVSFLAGPDSGWVNGQVLRANGGLG